MKLRIIGRGYVGTFLGEALGVQPEPSSAAGTVSGDDVVINCAGMTGRPNIDACEDAPGEAYEANVKLPALLVERAGYLVHLSTGCFFDGPSPSADGWTETDEPNLLTSVYCRTKRLAELALRRDNALCLRIRMPLNDVPHPRNLITKVRGYKRVIDAQNSVTYLPDLAAVVRRLLPLRLTGVLHVATPDTISPHDLNTTAEPVRTLQGITRAARSNCRLSVAKLERILGEPMSALRPRLAGILNNYETTLLCAAS